MQTWLWWATCGAKKNYCWALLGLGPGLLPLWALVLQKKALVLGQVGPKLGPIKCMGLEPNKVIKKHR